MSAKYLMKLFKYTICVLYIKLKDFKLAFLYDYAILLSEMQAHHIRLSLVKDLSEHLFILNLSEIL